MIGYDRVIFRTWEDGTVDAWLPELDANQGRMVVYSHIGQHSEGDYWGCMAKTRPSTAEEIEPLFNELKAIGYNPIIMKRYVRPKEVTDRVKN